MRASLLLSCAVVWAMSMGAACPPATKTTEGDTIRVVVFSCKRAADGTRRPNDVEERYELAADGQLKYSAYFYSMPIDLNHNDDMTWSSGDLGVRVRDVAAGLVANRTPGARLLDDSERASDCVYVIDVDTPAGSKTWVVERAAPAAWAALDGPFVALIAAFERETGRPLKPTELPQTP